MLTDRPRRTYAACVTDAPSQPWRSILSTCISHVKHAASASQCGGLPVTRLPLCHREMPGELQKIKEWFRDYKVHALTVSGLFLLAASLSGTNSLPVSMHLNSECLKCTGGRCVCVHQIDVFGVWLCIDPRRQASEQVRLQRRVPEQGVHAGRHQGDT